MNIFEQVASKNPKCDICGSGLIIMYGNGWDTDTLYCTDSECGAEYLFPTTTESPYKDIDIDTEAAIKRMKKYAENNPMVCIKYEGE